MKKRILYGLLMIIFIFTTVTSIPHMGKASTSVINSSYGFTYELNDDSSISITGYTLKTAEVNIPDEIGGKKVTHIAAKAFYDNDYLGLVDIPEGIISIGDGAFMNCDNLASISIPASLETIGSFAFSQCKSLVTTVLSENSSLKTIGDNAFSYCYKLWGMVLPDGVTDIGKETFKNCETFTSIIIPKTMINIGKDAFWGCEDLNYVYINDINSWCKINFELSDNAENPYSSNPLYYADKLYVENGSNTKFVLDDSITEIPFYAFSCENVIEVVLPDGLTVILEGAFANCKNLIKIDLPNTLTSISAQAFYSCERIESIIIPDSVTSIQKDTFSNAKKLREIQLPQNITNLDSIFNYCSGLTRLNIPSGVQNISSDMSFLGCSNLKYVFIPKTVTEINNLTFAECNNLWHILYEGTEEEWNTMTNGEFNFDNIVLHYNATFEQITVSETPSTCTTDGTLNMHCNICSTENSANLAASEHLYSEGSCVNCSAAEPTPTPSPKPTPTPIVCHLPPYNSGSVSGSPRPGGETLEGKIKFNKKTISVRKGKRITLKVKYDGDKKVKFTVNKKSKKIIKVLKKKKKKITLQGIKKGSAIITAKVGKKKDSCIVKVKK